MAQRAAKRILLIGWDAADWKMIDQLAARNLMPNLQQLRRAGVYADLATLEPKLSPLLWTSIATGKTADKHGILNFIEPNPSGDGVRISSSTTRKTKALWNILTQSGLRTNVVSWYASHPAEPINGACVSNLFQENPPATAREPWPLADGAVHPAELAAVIAKQRMHPSQLTESMLRPMIAKLNKLEKGDARLQTLKKLVAQSHSVHRAALAILARDRQWDCTMVFYDTIDTVGHHFMQFHPPRMSHVREQDFALFQDVMTGVYRLQDEFLGQLLKAAGPETTVILLSDHGFYSDELRPNVAELPQEERAAVEAAWHRPFGVLVMSGPGVKSGGEQIGGARILDVAPTALTLLGLPVGHDMDGRVLINGLSNGGDVEVIESWDKKTGEAGMHPADMRHDPFESRDALKQLVDLGYIAAPSDDVNALLTLTDLETRFNLALVYATTNRPADALPVLHRLATEKPMEARYVIGEAQCLFTLLKWDECIATLRKFLEKKPEHIDGRLMLASALGSAGHETEALVEAQKLEAAIEQRHLQRNEVSLGDVYSILRKWNAAELHYRRSLDADPRNPHALHGMARAALAQEKFEEATEFCLDALELRHVQPEAHYTLGAALAWLENYPYAIQSFQAALALEPGLVDAHRFLAAIFNVTGDLKNAKVHEERAAELLAGRDADTPLIEPIMGPADWARRHAASARTHHSK